MVGPGFQVIGRPAAATAGPGRGQPGRGGPLAPSGGDLTRTCYCRDRSDCCSLRFILTVTMTRISGLTATRTSLHLDRDSDFLAS